MTPGPISYALPAIGRPPEPPILRKIAIEEHFDHPGAAGRGERRGVGIDDLVRSMQYDSEWFHLVSERLVEFDELRLAEMDASGIDVAVLSQTVPGVQGIANPSDAHAAARDINDFLAEIVSRHPSRYAGFASIPLHDAQSAARELERCVTRLSFKGAMINGYSDLEGEPSAEYLDAPALLPFWEAAASLDVPIYLHPRPPLDQRAYAGHHELLGATGGFAPETATHALRLVYSGLFDRLPGARLILGHLGETLPYFAWRIQHCFEYNPADKRLQKRLQDYLCENIYVSTSGNFSDQGLIAAILTVGADRILFAADYPYEMMQPAARWIERAPISESDRRKIAHGNAHALLRLA